MQDYLSRVREHIAKLEADLLKLRGRAQTIERETENLYEAILHHEGAIAAFQQFVQSENAPTNGQVEPIEVLQKD